MPRLWLGHGQSSQQDFSAVVSRGTFSVATFHGWSGSPAQSAGKRGDMCSRMACKDVGKVAPRAGGPADP